MGKAVRGKVSKRVEQEERYREGGRNSATTAKEVHQLQVHDMAALVGNNVGMVGFVHVGELGEASSAHTGDIGSGVLPERMSEGNVEPQRDHDLPPSVNPKVAAASNRVITGG
jgi:hypothetical protein